MINKKILEPSEYFCPKNKKGNRHLYKDMTYRNGIARQCSLCKWIAEEQPDEYTNSSPETAR